MKILVIDTSGPVCGTAVMDENKDVRENRLRLLNRFESAFKDVANIGALAKRK